MRVGFSFSPGGLLLPYHLGVLASLKYHGVIDHTTPLAGSSAGAIAVASHACEVPPEIALDAAIRISKVSDPLFVAKGQLMPSLRKELDSLLSQDAHERVNTRQGMVGLAYRELYPKNQAILQTNFETRDSLIDAICDSSMFPFFTSNRPFQTYYPDTKQKQKPWKGAVRPLPKRVTVDGIFAVPLHRFGCPDFSQGKSNQVAVPDRTIRVLAFPHELVDINPIKEKSNIISPKIQYLDMFGQVTRMGLMAITKSQPKDLRKLYENGWKDAAEWVSSNN